MSRLLPPHRRLAVGAGAVAVTGALTVALAAIGCDTITPGVARPALAMSDSPAADGPGAAILFTGHRIGEVDPCG